MTGGEQRWAPFPVQDWSTMPEPEPLWGPPDAATVVVPAAASGPTDRRPWWLPLVVLLCLGLVVGTGTWLARRMPEPLTAALTYVPADGHVAWQQVDVTREAVTQTRTQVTESARFVGINGLLSGSSFLVTRVLHQDYDDDPSHSRLWRTDTSWVDGVGIPSQVVRYYRVRGSVELAGEQDEDGTITAYEPALVELPGNVGPGSTWRGSGSAGDTLDYTSSFRAAAGTDGCLDVTGELDLAAKGTGQVGRRTTVTRTWCPGRGLVASSESAGDVRTVTSAVSAPGPGPRATTSAPIAWTDPRTWAPRHWDTLDVDDGHTQPLNGAAETSPHPVLTASGLVVRAMSSPDDLLATTPKTTDAWTPAWRTHPGGRILTLAAFGSVVLVTTSDRTLVAYSDAGVRLWQTTLPEVGPTPPVQVSDADAVLVDLSGRVLRFGIADGAVRWTQGVGSDVNHAPAVGDGIVVVADRGGTVTALDAATGATRWDQSLETKNLAVVGDRVLVVQDQSVHGLDLTSGRTVFLRHYDGELTALTGFGGGALVVAKTGTLVLAPDGTVSARLPGYLTVNVTATHLVGWTTDRLDLLDTRGTVVASWPTTSTSLVSSDRPGLATPQGVYLFAFTKGWTFDSWTAGG